MRIKTVILDFDGTIVESVGIKDWAFETLFREYPDKLDEIMKYHLSHNATIRFEKFKYITEHILRQEYNGGVEKDLSQRFSELVYRRIVDCPYVPGAVEFLDDYHKILPLYLVSISPEDELDRILTARDLKKYFKKVYWSPWRKLEAVSNILREENLLPYEALFIGDSFEDYQSAHGARVFFIGRDSGKSFHGVRIDAFKDFLAIRAFLENLDVREGLTCQIT
jgi:phosphoglycolate phosphatase-like HAD superfamily hydrolase